MKAVYEQMRQIVKTLQALFSDKDAETYSESSALSIDHYL